MYGPSTTILCASLLLGPSLIQAQSNCRRTGVVFFNTFVNTIDNGDCNDRNAFETILKGTAFGCLGLTGSACNQDGTTATFSFNEAVTCSDGTVQAAVKQQFGVDVDCQ